MPYYYDTPGLTYNSGATYDSVAQPQGTKMNAKVALNLRGLTDRQILDKEQTAITAMTGNAAFPSPTNPTLATAQTNHDAALARLNLIDAKEAELKTLREGRDQLMAQCITDYTGLGSYAENKSGGNPATLTSGGFDLVGAPTAPQPMPKVQNNVLTTGDDAGTADGGWNSVDGKKSFEFELSPNGNTGWQHYKTTTTSSIHITGQTSGQKIWSRVRAINKIGEGPWSDPASCMIP